MTLRRSLASVARLRTGVFDEHCSRLNHGIVDLMHTDPQAQPITTHDTAAWVHVVLSEPKYRNRQSASSSCNVEPCHSVSRGERRSRVWQGSSAFAWSLPRASFVTAKRPAQILCCHPAGPLQGRAGPAGGGGAAGGRGADPRCPRSRLGLECCGCGAHDSTRTCSGGRTRQHRHERRPAWQRRPGRWADHAFQRAAGI